MVRQPQVAVVVDSSCCLPAEVVQQWGIIITPHELIIDGKPFRDGIDIHPHEFYQLLKGNTAALSTAAPRPQQFLEAFKEASRRAPNVLCLTLSASFSATYQSACAAVQLANSASAQLRVQVIDSGAAAGASGLIALAAAQRAATGFTLEQVVHHVNDLIPKVDLIAFLDTLSYLNRSGRVGKVQAWTGSMLGIKPVAELKLGEARMLAKPRSRARATEQLVEIMRQRVGRSPVRVNLMEADAHEDALALYRRIQAQFDCRELFVSQFTPVMGAHTGPGLLGVAFYADTLASSPDPATVQPGPTNILTTPGPTEAEVEQDCAILRQVLELGADSPHAGTAYRPFLIVLSGLPGTGKSYFARELTKRVPFLVLGSDRLRKALVAHPKYTPSEHSRVFAACHRLVEEYLAEGRRVLFDATNLTEFHRQPLYHMADRLGAPLITVRITAPLEVVRRRLEDRAAGLHPDDYSDADWLVYCRLLPGEEPITREHLTVHSAEEVPQVLQKVIRLVAARDETTPMAPRPQTDTGGEDATLVDVGGEPGS